MTKLYEYLISNYKPNEPIFVSDLHLSISDANLQQMFNLLCDSGKIKRFDIGIYYLPKESRLVPLPEEPRGYPLPKIMLKVWL